MNNKTLELKCMSCMPQKLSDDEYKNMCLGLMHVLKISAASMSALTQLQCMHNRKLKSFKPSELEGKDTSFSCLAFCKQHNLEYVCRCCQHSNLHNGFNETVEHMIISYCMKSRNTDYIANQLKNRGTLIDELFLSIFIAEPSRVDCYIPLNNYIINAIIEAGENIKKMEDDELVDFIMETVSYEFQLPKKIMNRIKKHIESFFTKTYTDADINNALDSVCCNIKSSQCSIAKLDNLKTVHDTEPTSNFDIKDNNDSQDNLDNMSNIIFTRTKTKQIPRDKVNTGIDTSTPSDDDKKETPSKEIVFTDKQTQPKQQLKHITDIDKDCLNEFGFLKNDITGSKENIIHMRNNFDEIRYDFLQADIFAVEYAVFHGQDGILFYLPKCRKYYFCSIHESTKNTIDFVTTILSDVHYHQKIVMFDIPFLFYLNQNGMSVKNYISIMELYLSAYHNTKKTKCTPSELIAKLVGEKTDIPFPFMVSAMKHYCGIYKKYDSFIKKQCPDNFSFLRLKHHMNRCVAHSFFISDIIPYKKCYINRTIYNEIVFAYHAIKDIIPEKYTLLTLSYENNIINTDRIKIALKSICSKISTTSIQAACNAKILNLTPKNIVILVPGEHDKIFLSALNHIAMKQGKKYIEPVPQISIMSNKPL